MELDEEQIALIRLITGELIVGEIDDEMVGEGILYVKNPTIIRIVKDSFLLAKYNLFSRYNFIMLVSSNIVYIDIPNDQIISYYKKMWENEETSKIKIDEDGLKHTIH